MDGKWEVNRRVVNGEGHMPRISQFYGIAIYLYYADHNPPHFHAVYAGQQAEITIGTTEVLAGTLPPRALKLVKAWTEMYRDELALNWKRARSGEPLNPVPPLS